MVLKEKFMQCGNKRVVRSAARLKAKEGSGGKKQHKNLFKDFDKTLNVVYIMKINTIGAAP